MFKIGILKSYLGLRFLSSLFFWIFATFSLVYQATVVGLNPFQLVLVGTLLEFSCFIFEIPTGIVADAYSRKLSVVIGVVLVGLGFILEGSIPVFESVLLAQIIWGGGYTFISGAREAWIADEVGEKEAGNAFLKGEQAAQLGVFIGIAASIFLANIDIRMPLIVGGFLYASQAFFIVFFMPEKKFEPTPLIKRETFKSMKNTFIEGVKLIRRNAVLPVVVITSVLFGAFSEGFDRLWTPFMTQSFVFPSLWNLDPIVWFGIIGMIASFLTIIASQVVRHKTNLSDHISVAKALFFTNSLLIIGVIAFALSKSFIVAMIAYLFAMMLREIRTPLNQAWANQNIPTKMRATLLSMCSQTDAIGQVIGGPILGLMATFLALRVSIFVAALILIPTVFFYIYSIKKYKTV